jgi:hypothetical protein
MAPAAPSTAPRELLVRVKVVDLEDRPLQGMRPVVTTTPNAFDPPLVIGEPTDATGLGSVTSPCDVRIYVRAWDPELKWFTNNYYDIPPATGTETPLMEIVMVRSAALDATLVTADSAPVADTAVEIMMAHPTKGPWWPSKARTDANGAVHFASLPAGTYTITFKAGDAGTVETPGVELPPGGHTDLGVLVLR